MSTMFGAPFGAMTGCGNCGGSESLKVRPTSPVKWKSGRGRMPGVAVPLRESFGLLITLSLRRSFLKQDLDEAFHHFDWRERDEYEREKRYHRPHGDRDH